MTRLARRALPLALALAVGFALGQLPPAAADDPAPMACQMPEVTTGAGILVREARHLEVALATASTLLEGDSSSTEAVEIIVCGAAVEALRPGSPQAAAVQAAASQGVRVVACGITLQRKGIDPGTLLPGVGVVDNGLVETLRLQAEGWRTVEL